jgi:23S rRNA U2552 (ribose-2'-O)-methylase RlmE/FtsJ
MSSWLRSVLFQESLSVSQQFISSRTGKMLMVKGIDELHIDSEEGFMVVKGNVRGERRKQKIILMRKWA